MVFCIDICTGAGGEAQRFWFVPPSRIVCGAALKGELEGLSAAQLREGEETQTNQGQFC